MFKRNHKNIMTFIFLINYLMIIILINTIPHPLTLSYDRLYLLKPCKCDIS